MKVLIIGDAVCSTGFARCTHAMADAMHIAGHEVHIIGINYYGDPHRYPYTIYPAIHPFDHGRDPFGVGRMPYIMERLKPDAVVLLNDPWNIPAYLEQIRKTTFSDPKTGKVPVIAWTAVDSKNQMNSDRLDGAHVVTWTQFGIDQLRAGGFKGPHSIVGLGVDRRIFHVRDKADSRAYACPEGHPSREGFIVGSIGRNQPRKRLDLTLEYFAEWVRRFSVPDAYLYLHVAPTGETGCDIRSLAKYHDIKDRVLLAEPGIGVGAHEEDLARLYSSFDLFLTTSQAEGWCLPVMEAMSCGIPCVVPDFAALGEWPGIAAKRVACTSSALTAPLNDTPYTIGGIMDREGAVEALNHFYRDRDDCALYSWRGLDLTSRLEYQWCTVGEAMCSIVENCVGVAV